MLLHAARPASNPQITTEQPCFNQCVQHVSRKRAQQPCAASPPQRHLLEAQIPAMSPPLFFSPSGYPPNACSFEMHWADSLCLLICLSVCLSVSLSLSLSLSVSLGDCASLVHSPRFPHLDCLCPRCSPMPLPPRQDPSLQPTDGGRATPNGNSSVGLMTPPPPFPAHGSLSVMAGVGPNGAMQQPSHISHGPFPDARASHSPDELPPQPPQMPGFYSATVSAPAMGAPPPPPSQPILQPGPSPRPVAPPPPHPHMLASSL